MLAKLDATFKMVDGFFSPDFSQEDKVDHSGRTVCVYSFFASGYHLIKEVAIVAYEIIMVVGATVVAACMLPVTALSAFTDKLEWWKDKNLELIDYSEKAIENVPKHFLKVIFFHAPLQATKMVGNFIGIFVPEVGRYVRQLKVDHHEWYMSSYAIDQKDHSERMISLVDLFSQLYRFGEFLTEYAQHVLKGFGAAFVAAIMVPITLGTFCVKSETGEKWREWHWQVVAYMGAEFIAAAIGTGLFVAVRIPQITVKLVGNAMGLIAPEMGQAIRLHATFKLPAPPPEDLIHQAPPSSAAEDD